MRTNGRLKGHVEAFFGAESAARHRTVEETALGNTGRAHNA